MEEREAGPVVMPTGFKVQVQDNTENLTYELIDSILASKHCCLAPANFSQSTQTQLHCCHQHNSCAPHSIIATIESPTPHLAAVKAGVT